MIDISPTLTGKASQLTADNLKTGDRIITISGVTLNRDNTEQPLSIHFEGDMGCPFKPCVTMRRVIAHMWGTDASQYKGRRLRLYRDESVKFGKEKVGGIRINAASHINEKVSCRLTLTRGKRGIVEIFPLSSQDGPSPQVNPSTNQRRQGASLQEGASRFLEAIDRKKTVEELEVLTGDERYQRFMAEARKTAPEIAERVFAAVNKKLMSFDNTSEGDDYWPMEGMPL